MEKCNLEINNKIYNSFKVEVRQINVVPQEKFKEEKIKKLFNLLPTIHGRYLEKNNETF